VLPQAAASAALAASHSAERQWLSGDNSLLNEFARWRGLAFGLLCFPRFSFPPGQLLYPTGMGLPKLPCSPWAGALLPPKTICRACSLGDQNPAPLWCGVGKWGAPNSAVKVAGAVKVAALSLNSAVKVAALCHQSCCTVIQCALIMH